MKRNIFTSLFAGVLLLGMIFASTSCSNDDYLKDYEIQKMIDESLNGQWQYRNVTVKRDQWVWNYNENKPYKGYYSFTANLPELTERVFDEGVVVAYYKHDNNSKTALPFIQTFDFEYTDTDGVTRDGNYTETISCDFALGNPSTVTFIIEASDRERFDDYLTERNFQIVLIW